MPGLALRFGQGLWSGALEASLIWLTAAVPNQVQGRSFLGSQVGFFITVSPLHTARYELAIGPGVDFYPLWHIHADERQIAFALRASGHWRIAGTVGLFGSARCYLVSSRGLDLGTQRDGSGALPVLFSSGAEWWFP
jgi:hypothetical protein